jgi:hypothetical protein
LRKGFINNGDAEATQANRAVDELRSGPPAKDR